MSRHELDFARSEVGMLEQFLADLGADELIARIQLEQRLVDARQRLAEVEALPQALPLPITFRGKPVEGTRSIDAAFAGHAIKAFVEATDTVGASLFNDLKGTGRLPGVGDRSLRIVDVALGSFGFELELPPMVAELPSQPSLAGMEESDPCVEAINTTLMLLEAAATDDEDRISDLIAQVHPRAAKKVRDFAEVLVKHAALCTLEFAGKQVRFDHEAQTARVMESLEDGDITEVDATHDGTLLGVLPRARTFEAKLADGKIVHGKVDRGIEDIDAFKTRWEGVDAVLLFRVVHVRKNQRFVLLGVETPSEPS